MLVATKSDLADQRQVSVLQGVQLAQKYGMNFYESSAFTGVGVEAGFSDVIENVISRKFEITNNQEIELEESQITRFSKTSHMTASVQLDKS